MEESLASLGGRIISLSGRPQQHDVLFFYCPTCENSHGIEVPFMPPALYGNNCVWSKTGSTIADISLSPSVDCSKPDKQGRPSDCKFHGWVRNGKVSW